MQCDQTATARGSIWKEEAGTIDTASGSARGMQMAQMVVCKSFGFRAILAIECVMVGGLTRSDVGRLGKGESNVFGRFVEVDRLLRAPQSGC